MISGYERWLQFIEFLLAIYICEQTQRQVLHTMLTITLSTLCGSISMCVKPKSIFNYMFPSINKIIILIKTIIIIIIIVVVIAVVFLFMSQVSNQVVLANRL